tara:strand:+ start:324 stop:749 length:426 start_codon:yes stop_codon:yes gene_type:complete
MAKKTKTIAKEVDDVAKLMQKLVRLKAADDNGYVRCCTCGVVRLWNDRMQGAHFISRGKLATKIMIENCHPACASCNQWAHKTTLGILEYRRYMVGMYDEDAVDELEALSRTIKKYNRAEVADIKSDFQAQIKFHQTRIGA